MYLHNINNIKTMETKGRSEIQVKQRLYKRWKLHTTRLNLYGKKNTSTIGGMHAEEKIRRQTVVARVDFTFLRVFFIKGFLVGGYLATEV